MCNCRQNDVSEKNIFMLFTLDIQDATVVFSKKSKFPVVGRLYIEFGRFQWRASAAPLSDRNGGPGTGLLLVNGA